jgi:hypothetical protein
MIKYSGIAWIMYEDAYNEAMMIFMENERSTLSQKSHKSNNEQFLYDFYETCLQMMDNGKDLSHKQQAIIEREINMKHINMPKLADFTLSFTISVRLDFEGKKFAGQAELGDFFLVLDQQPKIGELYERSFMENTHEKDFHQS